MITSLWEDIKEALYPVAYAEEEESSDNKAEEKAEEADEPGADSNDDDDESESKDEEKSEDVEESEDAESEEKTDDDEEEEEDEDEDDDEDDEDEDAVVDPLDTLRAKYTAGVCHDFKHHFDECTARVTAAMEQDDYEEQAYKEDCVEEFFHLQHCLDDNVSKTLFSKLR